MTEMRDSPDGKVADRRAGNGRPTNGRPPSARTGEARESDVTREMRDVDHTHPHTSEPFGDAFWGPAVAADGGEPDAEDDSMRDVDHESPDDEGADRVFERGTEGRTDSV